MSHAGKKVAVQVQEIEVGRKGEVVCLENNE